MKLPWQKTENTKAAAGSTKIALPQPAARDGERADATETREDKKLPKGYTPPKGRPTPKRIEQEVKRGVVRDPNALTPAQQNQRNKELRKSMSKQEWKDYKRKQREERRASNREMQARMDQGDERYLMDRDKGEVRRYVRDWVDSRYFINNWVMPIALVILVLTFLVSFAGPRVANVISLVSMAFMLMIIAEGFIIGRSANKAVSAKFPGTDDTGFSLGMYAFSRATQPRKWRTPKPQVAAGSKAE
ncbi:DUF3043 domain-containing protein [Corynebacterium sanguinis]|uniref:DUF3043 domain-containing protein n=1 Tax=Corynebacterium sanguinis TaxID=2594913 RepID=UPI00223AE32F|nr:DUF3043 domain-containing protein [Corynebacterium sanguinis]MCT1462763.1 DUF3043 domain-containing protein [Corynebacterium sanguinis]MCT1499084.1 DUF3043 domain-containing protein [Corynebacterium sanguinis]MCT2329013.1 DUF3043 domain-containing protein [Corynebacterium sanguinis]